MLHQIDLEIIMITTHFFIDLVTGIVIKTLTYGEILHDEMQLDNDLAQIGIMFLRIQSGQILYQFDDGEQMVELFQIQ